MTIQQLRSLVAVVTHGGFRAAARALDVSQGGLTKNISSLEEEYGVNLIERTAKGVSLSPQGEAFLHFAKAILQEADRAEHWLQNLSRDISMSVSLGVSVEPSMRLAPAVLSDFRKTLPNVMIRLTEGVALDLLAALRENRIELAVTKLPRLFDPSDLRVERLYQAEPVIVGRAGHPCAVGATIGWSWATRHTKASRVTTALGSSSIRSTLGARVLPQSATQYSAWFPFSRNLMRWPGCLGAFSSTHSSVAI